MCATIRYVCPACRLDSGIWSAIACPEPNDCGGPRHFERLMKAEHFVGWFCTTKWCGYNKINQLYDEREVAIAIGAEEVSSDEESDECELGDEGMFDTSENTCAI
jgi:hypothetical protein